MSEYVVLGTDPVTLIGSLVIEPASEFNRATHWLFWKLLTNRDYDNKAVIRIKNRTDANRMAAGYKVLFGLGWVKRIKQQHYFINPDVALSALYLYEDLIKEWRE